MTTLRRLICRYLHSGAMLPIHGRYTCPRCLLTHPVLWNAPREEPKAEVQPVAVEVTNA